VAEQMEGPLVEAQARHTSALAEGDASGLDGVSSAFERLGTLLLAAEAAADAAVAWRQQGSRRAGAAALRATTLAEQCDGATTPALQNIDSRLLLTRAERDAALLAATGRSSKEIAAQFGISARTVETQLQRAYEKLGVSSRDELRSMLGG
jgi:DNA-binding CsgD family transcriptional regulator